MSTFLRNLPNLKAAEAHWQRKYPDASAAYKLHEFIGALSFYCKAEDWDKALNTTYGYIKPVEKL